jgi:HD-GYP domain-containing protein (c-di-GMP phosphodiesterase class II)
MDMREEPHSGMDKKIDIEMEDVSDGARALAELVGLASRLSSAGTSEDLLDTFARGIIELWPGAGVRLCEVRAQAKCLVPVNHPDEAPIPIRGSFLGRAVSMRTSISARDVETETNYLKGKEAPSGAGGWGSALACPILLHGKPKWVVGVFLPHETVIGPGRMDLGLLEKAVGIFEPLLLRFEEQGAKLAAFREIAHAIASAVDARDPHLVGHGNRVSEFAQATARVHGLKDEYIERLGLAGLLHDIGRLGIPEHLLAKPGPLTPREYRIVRGHPVLSERFLEGVDYLSDVLPAIRNHHERYDGGGYPDGLEGDDIPLGARLIAVADAFDAMTSPRPFRAPMSDQEALIELKRESGGQFDPILVEAFLRAFEEKLILSQNVLSADDPLAEFRLNETT